MVYVFFDIDTCLYGNQLESCHGDPKAYGNVLQYSKIAFGGALRIAFNQIDSYMRSHPNEVIILHFNRDVIGDVAMVAKEIFAELEKRWDPNVASNPVKMSTERWPTLRQAIANNQRIFIFLHYGLAQYASGKNYIHMTAFSGVHIIISPPMKNLTLDQVAVTESLIQLGDVVILIFSLLSFQPMDTVACVSGTWPGIAQGR